MSQKKFIIDRASSEEPTEGLEKTNVVTSALNEDVVEIRKITDMNTLVASATNEKSKVIGDLNVN